MIDPCPNLQLMKDLRLWPDTMPGTEGWWLDQLHNMLSAEVGAAHSNVHGA